MDIGLFIPIANNGWLISEASPQYAPTFELNRNVVQRAEHYGLDFALSMVKLRGFGGKTEFWDYALESFTLMAGIGAVTQRIKLFASVAVLTMPPAIVARMATTIDSIAPNRFGVNIVTGWLPAEFDQMGLWPGDAYFGHRYDYGVEYVTVLRDLWEKGVSDFTGEFFTMRDCRMLPKPRGRIEIVGAGQSDRGIDFVATHGDYNFCLGVGKNTPTAIAASVARLVAAGVRTGRKVGAYVLFMVISAETDEEAEATWQSYRAGADVEALAWMAQEGGKDTKAAAASTAASINQPESAVNFNIGLLVGSHARVASMLDEAAEVVGVAGIMLIFDDFVAGMETFGTRVQPLMRCRTGIRSAR